MAAHKALSLACHIAHRNLHWSQLHMARQVVESAVGRKALATAIVVLRWAAACRVAHWSCVGPSLDFRH
jgi:hypothetical protein